jgi:DNA-binding IclR family transcriptional regulator
MVCNEVCYGRTMLTLRVSVGSRLALSTSAVGRAPIGALPDEQRNALLKEIRENFKDEWAQLGPAVDDLVTQIRDKQFYTSIGTLEQGVNGAGAMLDIAGAPYTYVIGIAAPAFRFEPELLEQRVGPRLLETKCKIEKQMAAIYRPS